MALHAPDLILVHQTLQFCTRVRQFTATDLSDQNRRLYPLPSSVVQREAFISLADDEGQRGLFHGR